MGDGATTWRRRALLVAAMALVTAAQVGAVAPAQAVLLQTDTLVCAPFTLTWFQSLSGSAAASFSGACRSGSASDPLATGGGTIANQTPPYPLNMVSLGYQVNLTVTLHDPTGTVETLPVSFQVISEVETVAGVPGVPQSTMVQMDSGVTITQGAGASGPGAWHRKCDVVSGGASCLAVGTLLRS
ncbi:MAG TPA: hypothetical protein VG245_05860 [Candidatus Dormibacteraeota bacterium]|jgi:hypothetical protein|nr:hypothetical protein [Candidatus Dormibacteraeota bacterium]